MSYRTEKMPNKKKAKIAQKSPECLDYKWPKNTETFYNYFYQKKNIFFEKSWVDDLRHSRVVF